MQLCSYKKQYFSEDGYKLVFHTLLFYFEMLTWNLQTMYMYVASWIFFSVKAAYVILEIFSVNIVQNVIESGGKDYNVTLNVTHPVSALQLNLQGNTFQLNGCIEQQSNSTYKRKVIVKVMQKYYKSTMADASRVMIKLWTVKEWSLCANCKLTALLWQCVPPFLTNLVIELIIIISLLEDFLKIYLS